MSTEHSHDHSGHGAHHEPTSFFRKYVFSTDHKIIAIQFTMASLLFVIIGGSLALAVRYQLAWPFQNVPYAKLLPGEMTKPAPEANIALWRLGETVKLKNPVEANGQTIPAETLATLTDMPKGLAVTIPAGTQVQINDETPTVLENPVDGFISKSAVMGDYDYTRMPTQQQARAVLGSVVDVGGKIYRLIGVELHEPDGPGKSKTELVTNRHVLLTLRAQATPVQLTIAGQTVKSDDKEVQVAATSVQANSNDVIYTKLALSTDSYLQLFTMHATIMVFFVLMPMLLGGFGNYLIPLMIGARDMAFPKLNALSFWLSVPAAIVMLISFWTPGGASGGGWTMYPTLSEHEFSPSLGTTLWVVSIGLVGFSTIVGTLNYITTTINMRAPGMTMFRMPLTVWGLFITAILALLATPVLTAAAILLLLDRTMGTTFFTPATGGQPLMWQHLFWFFGHPEVYILILPTMGLVSDILATHARKPIFGYRPMVFAMAAISGLGFIVWGHHMFQSGMNPVLGTTFMAATIMIAVPSAIKVFNWLGTLWGGNIRFTPPMLFALGFVSMFTIGGLSGIFMASAPVDIHIHDTYFIVAHIHYVFFGGTLFGVWAGIYHWYPKIFGRQLNQKWGHIHFWMSILAFNGTFFLMHILGLGGHPRRYAAIMEYPTLQHLQPLNVFMTISSLMLGAAQLPFFYNFFASLPRKLSRAVVAIFAIGLVGPAVIGLTFYSKHAQLLDTVQKAVEQGSLNQAAQDAATAQAFWSALGAALGIGLVFILAVFAAVWIIWAVGGALRMPALLQRLLYVAFLPAYLSPLLLKPDAYLWLGVPTLYDSRCMLLGLSALPGLIYLLVWRPKDEFGYAVGDNPWQSNSLEWCTTSPPPFTNFEHIPTVHRGPYEYSSPVIEEDYLPQPAVLPVGVVEPSGH